MCDMHRTHVTVVEGIPRCVLCGHKVFDQTVRWFEWPREIFQRSKARKAWWNRPTFHDGVFRY